MPFLKTITTTLQQRITSSPNASCARKGNTPTEGVRLALSSQIHLVWQLPVVRKDVTPCRALWVVTLHIFAILKLPLSPSPFPRDLSTEHSSGSTTPRAHSGGKTSHGASPIRGNSPARGNLASPGTFSKDLRGTLGLSPGR